LTEKLAQDGHELVEVGEVEVVASVGHGHDFDARVFASESLGGFLRDQGRLCPGADDQRGALDVAHACPGRIRVLFAAPVPHTDHVGAIRPRTVGSLLIVEVYRC